MALLWHMDVMSSGLLNSCDRILAMPFSYKIIYLFLTQVLIFVTQKKQTQKMPENCLFPPPTYIFLFILGWVFFQEKFAENGRRDKEFIMLAVALNGLCLQYASVELRSDRQVVLQAIRSNPYAFLGLKQTKTTVLTELLNCMECCLVCLYFVVCCFLNAFYFSCFTSFDSSESFKNTGVFFASPRKKKRPKKHQPIR